MVNWIAWMGGVGMGVAAAWWADPQSGRRRRAVTRDKVTHAVRHAQESAQVVARDAQHRARGVRHALAGYLEQDLAPDEIITERVRAHLGHVCTHPGAVHVSSRDGHVTLYGAILQSEVDRVLAQTARVRGVAAVENRMDVHPDARGVPALQGGTRAGGLRPWSQRSLSPTARAATTGVGALLCLGGLARGGLLGLSGMLLGAGLVARGAGDFDLVSLQRVARRRGALTLHKSLVIQAPVEACYSLWGDLEQVPACLSQVRSVTRIGDGRYRWTMEAADGRTLEWDALVTQAVPHRVLAWKSADNAELPNAGVVTFTPCEDGGTYLDVQLHYLPLPGLTGRGVAALLGADPAAQLHEDLARFKARAEGTVQAATTAEATEASASDTAPWAPPPPKG